MRRVSTAFDPSPLAAFFYGAPVPRARIQQTITIFLLSNWRSGALIGTKPEDAFFVRCDSSTMTQDDIDDGRLIAQIGVAPVQPAEFVIIRIGLWTASRCATC